MDELISYLWADNQQETCLTVLLMIFTRPQAIPFLFPPPIPVSVLREKLGLLPFLFESTILALFS